MLKKLIENKKIWIPVAIVILVVIAVAIGVSTSKDAEDTDNKNKFDISAENNVDDAGKDKANDVVKNENGLTEVEEDKQTEDTITPPASWDGSENTNNKTNSSDSGSNNSNSNNNSNSGNTENDSGNQEEEDNVTSEDVLEDDKKFGTIF